MKTTTFAPFHRACGFAAALTAVLAFTFPSAGYSAAGGIPAEPDHNPAYSAIVVLGDSLSDTGRTSAVLTQLGYQFPPPNYAPGRVSNGPVWIEYFAPMMRRTYQPWDNFSWAGATTGTENVLAPFLPGMLNQLGELIGTPPRALDPKALYVVFGGANDFLNILRGGNPYSLVPGGVSNLLTIVAAIRAAGAEHIVVVGLPDIGRTPRAIAGGPASVANATALSLWFNSLLNDGLNALQIPVVRVDLFKLMNDFVAHPQKYGFTNVTSMSLFVPNADTYLFWDDVHPTTRGHRHVANAVFHALAAAGKVGQQKN